MPASTPASVDNVNGDDGFGRVAEFAAFVGRTPYSSHHETRRGHRGGMEARRLEQRRWLTSMRRKIGAALCFGCAYVHLSLLKSLSAAAQTDRCQADGWRSSKCS
jgi:hypothetical protein